MPSRRAELGGSMGRPHSHPPPLLSPASPELAILKRRGSMAQECSARRCGQGEQHHAPRNDVPEPPPPTPEEKKGPPPPPPSEAAVLSPDPWRGHRASILNVRVSADGKHVLTGAGGLVELRDKLGLHPDNSVRRWGAASGKEVQ